MVVVVVVVVVVTANWTWEAPEVVCSEGEEIAPRTGHAATKLDERWILISGGWDYSDCNSEPKRFDDVYLLDTGRC